MRLWGRYQGPGSRSSRRGGVRAVGEVCGHQEGMRIIEVPEREPTDSIVVK